MRLLKAWPTRAMVLLTALPRKASNNHNLRSYAGKLPTQAGPVIMNKQFAVAREPHPKIATL